MDENPAMPDAFKTAEKYLKLSDEDKGELIYDTKIKFEDWINGNFWNNLFFFFNIISYLIFCSYLATL